jgi:glycerol dehydrogenase-like iron-containing ADH family enzyme
MLYAAIFPNRYIQGKNALYEICSEISRLGKTGLLICSPTVNKNIIPNLKSSLDNEIKYCLS